MTGRRAALAIALLVVAGGAYWITGHTYWADIQVPMPLKGDARTNPTYAAQRFVERLGVRASRDRVLVLPPATGVIVLSAWNWELSPSRRQALERWVESGGRLVVDSSINAGDEFGRWSGIVRIYRAPAAGAGRTPPVNVPQCRRFHEEYDGGARRDDAAHWLCDVSPVSTLTTRRTPEWQLREQQAGVQAARMRIGRGTVTVVNTDPFRYRALFDGDHGWLLVAAARLRAGDEAHFLSEADYPSLLALTWQHGAPVLILVLTAIALMLWRGGTRVGPLAPAPPAARRSLAEQIRGSGEFALRHGSGDALHAATVHALDLAARRRVPAYERMTARDRAAALARLTGIDADTLASAIYHPRMRGLQALPGTLALLETARRRLLLEQTGPLHGTS